MGSEFVLKAESEGEGWGRTVTSFGVGRSEKFFEIAKMLEQKLQYPCGIKDWSYMDMYEVDPQLFISFFEKFMSYQWEGEGIEHFYNWAANAAGIIANATLEFRLWKTPQGEILPPQTYGLDEENLREQMEVKRERYWEEIKEVQQLQGALDKRFDHLPMERHAQIIEETPATP